MRAGAGSFYEKLKLSTTGQRDTTDILENLILIDTQLLKFSASNRRQDFFVRNKGT